MILVIGFGLLAILFFCAGYYFHKKQKTLIQTIKDRGYIIVRIE